MGAVEIPTDVHSFKDKIVNKNFKVGKYRFLELYLLNSKHRTWKHEFRFFDINSWVSLSGDHSPSFGFEFTLLGVEICQIHFYDCRHEEQFGDDE